MATTFAPDAARDEKALAIAEGAGQWLKITLREQHGAWKAGTRFYGVPSSTTPGAYYTVNFDYCSCPAYANYSGACKHQRAVAYHVAAVRRARRAARQQQNGEASPASPTPATVTRYSTLYPACAAGCGDPVERKGENCYRCLSDETHRRDTAAKLQARRQEGAEIARQQIEAGMTFADALNPLAE